MKDGILPDFIPSNKVKVGKIVDDIRMGTGLVRLDDPLYPMAKDIAEKIRVELGDKILSQLQSQNSYHGEMETSGIKIKIKGRPDWELGIRKVLAVIDLKVTFQKGVKKKEDLIPLIDFMGYDNQIWNYAKLDGAESKLLFIHSAEAKKTFFYNRLIRLEDNEKCENWWGGKILEYGTI
jgi:hypothetical protein